MSNMSSSTVHQPRSCSRSNAPHSTTLSESTPVAVPNAPGTLRSDSPLTPLDEPSVSFAEEEESIVANASFTFEVDQDDQLPTDWTFAGPIAHGPL